MSSGGRAFVESFVLHGLLAGALIAVAGSFTPPPQTIRLDFRMLEQPAAPAPKAESEQKPTAVAAPVSTPPVASPSPAAPRSQPKVQPVPAQSKPAPAPPPPSFPDMVTPNVGMPVGLATSKDTEQATSTSSGDVATVAANHGPATGAVSGGTEVSDPAAAASEEYRRANFEVIRDSILGNLRYPVLARRKGWSGQVEIAFMITPDGNVSELRINASSGFPVLDDQALTAIRRSAPFPPPRMAALMVMPVTFQLN